MFTLRTSDVNYNKAMSIKVNTKETETVVYDKANLNYAYSNEVVSLITSVRGNLKDNIIELISKGLNLLDSERELYTIISNMVEDSEDVIDYNYLINKTVSVYNKSNVTYFRATSVLIRKGVIRYATTNYISVNPEYCVYPINEAAKYIVIEIKPKDVQRQTTL